MVDFLSEAKKNAAARGITNVGFVSGNALDLSQFPDNSFDVVHEHQLLLHVPTPVQAIREMWRVVKPGGILSLRDNFQTHTTPDIPNIQLGQESFHRLKEKTGAEEKFGLNMHLRAHEAGFEYEKMEFGCVAWEVSGHDSEAKRSFAQNAGTSLNAVAQKLGVATDEELKLHRQGWEEFGKMPESRFVCVDGTLICRK
jgi:SAM-dependent methyltransferase